MTHVQQQYSYAFIPTSGTAFTTAQVPNGIANGIMIIVSAGTGLTLTLADGSTTCVFGNHTVGHFIPVRCTKVTFATTGSCVAMA